MKLRTQCHEAHGYPVFFCAPPCDVQHDAAVAHALRLAICELPNSLRATVIADADSYLAEWGFGEG